MYTVLLVSIMDIYKAVEWWQWNDDDDDDDDDDSHWIGKLWAQMGATGDQSFQQSW